MSSKDQDAIHLESQTNEPNVPTTNEAQYGGKDKAAQFLRQVDNPVITVTAADNARILRKIDLRILPIILFVYCLQSLDKTSLSYASVFGLIEDTHLVGVQFSWLSSVVYVAQLVFQPLIAYSLVRLPVGKFCSTMVLCWGVVLCGMTAATSFGGLMAARLLLGVFEASVAPSFIAIVQMWYRRREQTLRIASWYAMLGVVNMLGSLLTYALGHIHSGVLHPYQDKLIAIERLRMNQMGIGSGIWKWDHVRESFLDLKTWLWFCIITVISIPSGGISTFGPLIIQSFGFNSFDTILFNIPFGAVQMISTLSGAWLANRIQMKSLVILLLCLPPIAGCSMLIAAGRDKSDRAILLAGYYIISVYPGITPLIYSWSAQNTAGDTKRKVTTAMLFVGASIGNIVGPQLFKPSEKPRYDRGLRTSLALFIALVVMVLLGMLWIKILNRKQAARRKAMGKAEIIVDVSMMEQKKSNGDDLINQGDESLGDKAFEDVTDLANEDFIYVY